MPFNLEGAGVKPAHEIRVIHDFESSDLDQQQIIRPGKAFYLVVGDESTKEISKEGGDSEIQEALEALEIYGLGQVDVTNGLVTGVESKLFCPIPSIQVFISETKEKSSIQPVRISLGKPSNEWFVLAAQPLDPQLQFVIKDYYEEAIKDMSRENDPEQIVYRISGPNFSFTPTKEQIWEACSLTVVTNFEAQDEHLRDDLSKKIFHYPNGVKTAISEPSVRFTAIEWMKLSKSRPSMYTAALNFTNGVISRAPKKRGLKI